jgi:hypothetical protein
MIHPKTQEFMASRMRAGLHRLDVDHTPIATAPEKVIRIVREALRAAAR